MSIKKAGQFTQVPLQPNLQPLSQQAPSQSVQTDQQAGVNNQQHNFESFPTAGVQQARVSTGQAVTGGMSVLQQSISQLSGVSGVGAVLGAGQMSTNEVQALETQTGNFLGHMQGLAAERPEAFAQSLQQVFAGKLDSGALQQLVSQAKDGDFPMPSQIKFVDSDVLRGADAAYTSQEGGVVLLNRDLADRPARLQIALTEEIGHHLDQVIGGGDSIGDEGELFQRAMAKGGPLTGLELRAGKFDSDQGQITLNGQTLSVEFRSDKTARFYEAQGSFNKVDLRAAGRIDLADTINDRLIEKHNREHGANVTDVRGLKSHMRREGQSIVTERIQEENKFFQEMTGVTQSQVDIDKKLVHKFRRRSLNGQPIRTPDDVKAYCEANGRSFERELAYAERKLWYKARKEYTENKGLDTGLEAQAATLIAKLKKGDVLGETANLDTELPLDVLTRVERDPVLSAVEPPIDTYGDLFKALTTDVDNDGKSDFDTLQLGRFLPGSSQQQILKAVDTPIDNADLKEALRGAGFEHRLVDRLSARGTLSIDPPKAFGLEGHTDLERTQQQLLLRTGKVFMDSNNDGKISDTDVVQYIDSAGSVRETTYGELDSNLKKLVKYNIATTKACEDYAALPRSQRMKFPHYHSATGESDPEVVNEDFWEVSKANANRGQISWELKNDALPSDAINDVFNGNGGKYTTECAQGRTMLRLVGLNNYYKAEFGEGEGTFRFNALFAKGNADKSKANAYIQEFESFKTSNPDKTWDDFTADNPMPDMAYALEVSRHTVFGDNETYMQPWRRANTESASGDTGYFHNYSVSVEGVKIGYVGENVIDMGYKDGIREYWGHPGGIQTEDKWSHELGSRRIKVHNMSEYSDYFSSVDITRGSARVTKDRVADLQDAIEDLQTNKPAGWEDQVKQHESTIGWWKALDVARQAVATEIDGTKAEAAGDFFSTNGITNRPESFDPLLETMTPEGVEQLAAGFEHLDEGTIESVVNYFNKSDATELTEQEKATSTLLLTFAQSGRMHPVLVDEGQSAIKNIHFEEKSSWIKPGGHMASKDAFQDWLSTDAFKDWYKTESGNEYSGETDLTKMTIADVKELVEMVFPMAKGVRTIYSQVNSRERQLSEQMATLLKEGKLPDAEYDLDSNPVAPLD